MSRLVVERSDGTQVATVTRVGSDTYLVSADDEGVGEMIRGLLDDAKGRGLPHGFYRRQETPTGLRYERSGRWVKPGDSVFLEALGDNITTSELIAYSADAR